MKGCAVCQRARLGEKGRHAPSNVLEKELNVILLESRKMRDGHNDRMNGHRVDSSLV